MKRIKVALAQMKSKLLDKHYNVKIATNFIERAASEDASVICLPELFFDRVSFGA